MSKRKYIVLLVMLLLGGLPAICRAADEGTLLKVVVLSRHGVRAPTQDNKILDLWSQKTWPIWPVAKGDLTPRGAELVTSMWQNLLKRFIDLNFLPKDVCSQASLVHVRADTDERTQATAQAILEGLAPNCSAGYYVSDDSVDPLFHPVKAGLYRYDPVTAVMDVLSMTSGSLENLQERLSGPVNLLGRIVGPISPTLCARFGLAGGCQLEDLPNAVSVAPDGKGVSISGALGVASSLAEIFLLEYGEWPEVSAGWGKVNSSILGQIMPVHSRVFDVVNRAPVVAWSNGSSLLNEITKALLGRHADTQINEARLMIYVGHDTNIANIGGLLGLNWQGKGYPLNGIPPAGALFFELWEKQGRKTILVRFFSQPPQALHAPFTGNVNTDIETHAPIVVNASAPPIVGQAIYNVNAFEEKVATATSGAPIAPVQTLHLQERAPVPQP